MIKQNFTTKAVIVSPDIYPDSVKKLNSMGIEVLFSCKNKSVLPHLAYHADMQITAVSHSKFVVCPECFDYYTELLKKFDLKLICGNTYLSCNYPGDIAYNIIVTENYAIHNFKYTDEVLKENLSSKKFINVSQGYTACTLCTLSDTAYITSDAGVSKILKNNGFDVLSVNDTAILLPGFDHGFFGGSSFMVDSHILAVNGNISLHPCEKSIREFLQLHNIEIVSLSDNPIMDIGSFINVCSAT